MRGVEVFSGTSCVCPQSLSLFPSHDTVGHAAFPKEENAKVWELYKPFSMIALNATGRHFMFY